MTMRFTAEHRGGDFDDDPLEWCVVDEDVGPTGSAMAFGLSQKEAKDLALVLNQRKKLNE
jgi:hypothetical protein